MSHADIYVRCKICGGDGWYNKKERIGSTVIDTPKRCVYCGGNGEILKSKIDRSLREIVKRNRRKV